MGRKRKLVDTESKSKANLPPCRVCDAPGAGFHYGANTCEACKGFFHRSLKLHDQYKCEGSGNCAIEHGKEKLCQLCRYQKCLSVGMGKNAIKTGRYTSVKRTNDILEVKKLQQSGKVKQCDSSFTSSQILKLLTSPRADSHPGIFTVNESHLDTQGTISQKPVTFTQLPTNMQDRNNYSVNQGQSPAQLPVCSPSPSMTFADSQINSPSTESKPHSLPENSSNEIFMPDKPSFLNEISENMSPLALLSATATAVLTNQPGYSPLTPPEVSIASENADPFHVSHVSPVTTTLDISDLATSPLSIGFSGPSSNSSTASPRCLNSHAIHLDMHAGFCDSCSCHSEDQDISCLYQDYRKVVEKLIEAHESFVIPVFGRLSPEEQLRQQLEHLENCRLHNEIFGPLPRLQDNEYDDIYESTGLDTDGRKHKFSTVGVWMENMIRGMVKFAKAIPGFGKLSTVDKVTLIKYARQEFCQFSMYTTLNCELRVMRGGDNEWKCENDMVKFSNYAILREFLESHFNFCKTLQNLNLSEEEQVVVKAVLIMAPDRSFSLESNLANEMYLHLIQCLHNLLSQKYENPNLKLAQIISRMTEARTMTEFSITFLKNLKIDKYTNILENPLLREMMAGIVFDFKEDET